jgi:hypothetical protein
MSRSSESRLILVRYRASRVSLDTIQKTLKQMDSNIRNLQTDINNNRVPQSGDDKFLEVMEVRNYPCDNCHFWPVNMMSDMMCCDSA